MDKQAWRNKMQALRRQLSAENRAELSAVLCQKLMAALLCGQGSRVMAYLPIRGEVDLSHLLLTLEERGAEIVLPKVMGAGRIEPFLCPQPWQEHVQVATYGICEPSGDARQVETESLDYVLVPGLAFDREFYRLGYGGGYYDRFLPRLGSRAVTIGVAFAIQVVESLPHEEHDGRLDALITEQGLVWREAVPLA